MNTIKAHEVTPGTVVIHNKTGRTFEVLIDYLRMNEARLDFAGLGPRGGREVMIAHPDENLTVVSTE